MTHDTCYSKETSCDPLCHIFISVKTLYSERWWRACNLTPASSFFLPKQTSWSIWIEEIESILNVIIEWHLFFFARFEWLKAAITQLPSLAEYNLTYVMNINEPILWGCIGSDTDTAIGASSKVSTNLQIYSWRKSQTADLKRTIKAVKSSFKTDKQPEGTLA